MADDATTLGPAEHRFREKRLTVEAFTRLANSGFLHEPGVHELWDGRIMMAPPPGGGHMRAERKTVAALILALQQAGLSARFAVQPGGGLQLDDYNLRGPDIMVLRLPIEGEGYIEPAQVALLIEIAVSSLPEDLSEKRHAYAAAGLAEYWVFDVTGARLLCFRNPIGGVYPKPKELEVTDEITPLFAPELRFQVGELI